MISKWMPVQTGFAVLLIAAAVSAPGFVQAQPPAGKTVENGAKAFTLRKPQSDLASKTAVFGTVGAADPKVKAALDAHNLAGAKALVGKTNSLTGTVAGVFAPRSGKFVILNFDKDYKASVSAVVEAKDFGKFPDLMTLKGKKVLVTGNFRAFHDSTEVVVTALDQVKTIK